jgi:tRNA 2-thiouridine synthesizing protein A
MPSRTRPTHDTGCRIPFWAPAQSDTIWAALCWPRKWHPGQGVRVTPPGEDPVIIDGGDRACVQLLLELRARISGLPPGTLIHLNASDPAASIDLPAWCHLTGHAYLGAIPTASTPTYVLRTTATPVATDPTSPWRLRP